MGELYGLKEGNLAGKRNLGKRAEEIRKIERAATLVMP